MATQKSRKKTATADPPTPHSESYEAALGKYTQGLELIHAGDFMAAIDLFTTIAMDNPDEPELAERARAYVSVCSRKLASEPEQPTTAEGLYHLGVHRANDGSLDEALDLLNRGLELELGSARMLYARASVFALKGQADDAVADLRKAIESDPKLRFQAGNDPDFERVRDEASFIDVIEPTPTGA
jgi:tetratricopeptide (TPR) repeat protein